VAAAPDDLAGLTPGFHAAGPPAGPARRGRQAYPLAVAAYALSILPGAEAERDATLDLLMALARTGGVGMHWEPYPVETTAYAALALMAAQRPEALAAVEFLYASRGSLGGFGSTQDTVMAFRALTRAALDARRDVHGAIDLVVDGAAAHTFEVNALNYDLLQSHTIAAGAAEAALAMHGTGAVGYQVAKHFHLPGESIPPPRHMLIEVVYDTHHVAVDDTIDVNVRLLYPGPRERTNMVIADVGVPTGFAAVPESLAAIRETALASNVEVAVRKVIFYIPELVREEPLDFTFQVRALFPVRAAPAASTAYDYYAPEERGTDPGTGISAGGALFIRGDANRDAHIDISDAVHILTYLFGNGILTCLDAADVNDDGKVNIADPIALLAHLFAGSAPPPPPWPTPGVDPTDDGLDCVR